MLLQRAASNAYSWWWASHIRTTQSKWLDAALHDMEERIKATVSIIGADGDSFGKKAEIYFRCRPELINHVEEILRSYLALAERYDRISSELHKANHTIATAFPDQIQYSMQEDGEGADGFPKALTGIDLVSFRAQDSFNSRNNRGNQTQRRTASTMNKDMALEKIDKLQKQILTLQTEKEFLKTSYDNALGKYLEIERQVVELQDEVCVLQDTFSTGTPIEDNEARALMAASAIVSCEQTLVNLEDQQKRLFKEASVEFQRLDEAKRKLTAFMDGCGQPQTQIDDHDKEPTHELPSVDGDGSVRNDRTLDLHQVCDRIKEVIELHPEVSAAQIAEKVDRVVDKVITLELATTSQNAQIDRMKSEIDDLHKRLRALEEEKAALIVDSSKLANRLKQVEGLLQTVQQIRISIHNVTYNIYGEMKEARRELSEFVEKLHIPIPEDEDSNFVGTSEGSELASQSAKKETPDSLDGSRNEMKRHGGSSDDPVVRAKLVANPSDGEDSILLEEHASVLQSYKETEQTLSEIEKQNRNYHTEAMSELEKLKGANRLKDEEIHTLRRMISSLQKKQSVSASECVEKSDESSKKSIAPTTEGKEIAEIEEYINQSQVEEPVALSPVEEKFRAEIDSVLEDNLDFWLRFSTSYHQIRKFQESFDRLKAEMDKLTDEQAQGGADGISTNHQVVKLESAVLEKKFRDLNTDLQVWMETNVLLKGELENRFSSLCSIQEHISKITTPDKSDEVHFTRFQAAKFQGEVLNMKQENNKVARELEYGMDHVRDLQVEVGRALLQLRDNMEISMSISNRDQQNHRTMAGISTRSVIPLRTFLFGRKPRKSSLFSCMGPGMYGGSKAGRR